METNYGIEHERNFTQDRRPQTERNRHIFLVGLVFLIIVILLIALFPKAAQSADKQQIGYLVCINSGAKHAIEKTTEIAEVYAIMELCFPGNCIQIEKQLYRTEIPVFEMYVGDMGVYIELKIVKRVKKNGDLVLRRYKKRQ